MYTYVKNGVANATPATPLTSSLVFIREVIIKTDFKKNSPFSESEMELFLGLNFLFSLSTIQKSKPDLFFKGIFVSHP